MGTKNDQAWEKIFKKYNILNEIEKKGFYEILADHIREYREPRLMCKFDHKNNLPDIFKKYNLNILPISTKSYIIGDFKLFEDIKYDDKLKPKQMSIPAYIETVKPADLYSEASALHCAHITGMIDDFLGEESLFTVSGRMGSGNFDYNVLSSVGTSRQINVSGAQIEIDGGYESHSNFVLIEAKKQKVNNFNIRQLYYPYRVWKERTNKVIKPVFFTISNDVFHFFEFRFEDDDTFNSITLVKQKSYTVNYEKITQQDVDYVVNRVTTFVPEPEVPFPQADDFTKVIDLLSYLYEQDMTKDDIAEQLDFDKRQSDYYYNSCLYLGLANKYTNEEGTFATLNDKGREIVRLPFRQKRLAFAELILQHEIFKEIYDKTVVEGKVSTDYIVSRMKHHKLYNINSETTFRRRASTIRGWVKWIMELPNK
ncbi:type II restriction enzyme [Ureibacillus sp. FSL K6-2830]|uniref:type II restriction enzyme n=1 Tax=Ureibacillus sp. FSL K6-2830 TaxID=2954610 RepID=UPI0030FB0642